MSHPWKHFCTITRHRWLVRKGCFQVGLYWQGLIHDLSKYAPTEFRAGAKYYQGTRSPNTAQREAEGCSQAWMHHKGRNRHHYEYWTDIDPETKEYVSMPMPRKYLAEMVMDRLAACKVYEGSAYTDSSPLNYFMKSRERLRMNETTRTQLGYLLTMLRDRGERETFTYIRTQVLRGKPFPWELAEAECKKCERAEKSS